MTPWLALSLGLCLGQTPEVTPAVPPDSETQDPAALQLRDAWERALLNADATDVGQDTTDGSVQMPALVVGAPANALPTVPVPTEASPQQAGGLGTAGTGGAGTVGASEGTEATQSTASTPSTQRSTGNARQDVAQLRSQIQSLQEQLEDNTANTTQLQQQLTGIQERAQELELMRQQRLSEMERARSWLVAADQALAVGEMAVGDALSQADSALAQVVDSATASGNGQTAALVEDARGFISQALESIGHRDTYEARGLLLLADWWLQEARRRNLDASSATVVTQ